jgi:hypothetical protein
MTKFNGDGQEKPLGIFDISIFATDVDQSLTLNEAISRRDHHKVTGCWVLAAYFHHGIGKPAETADALKSSKVKPRPCRRGQE